MRRHSFVIHAAALAVAVCICADAAPILDPARISDRTFDNGFRVVVKDEDQWGLASAGLYIRAGSAQETDEQIGAAHLLEHLMFEATDARPEPPGGAAHGAGGGGRFLRTAQLRGGRPAR